MPSERMPWGSLAVDVAPLSSGLAAECLRHAADEERAEAASRRAEEQRSLDRLAPPSAATRPDAGHGGDGRRAVADLDEAPIDPSDLTQLLKRERDGDESASRILVIVRSAKSGNPDGQYHLGGLLRAGSLIAPDPQKALAWYLRAARQGHQDAQYEAGVLLERGDLGLSPDLAQAMAWYEASAAGGNDQARAALARIAGELQRFLWLFEQIYGVTLRPSDRDAIAAAIRDAVGQDEPSGRQLFEYVLRVSDQLGAIDANRVAAATQQLRDVFARAFFRYESNERGRILAVVHLAIEQARPGATGVPPKGPPSPFRNMPVLPPGFRGAS